LWTTGGSTSLKVGSCLKAKMKCPLCSLDIKDEKTLIKHCLVEINRKQKWVCQKCWRSKPRMRKSEFWTSKHRCMGSKGGFEVVGHKTRLTDLQSMLYMKYGITSQSIREVITQTRWKEKSMTDCNKPKPRKRQETNPSPRMYPGQAEMMSVFRVRPEGAPKPRMKSVAVKVSKPMSKRQVQ